MISEDLARKILNVCYRRGVQFAEVYAEDKLVNVLKMEDSRLERAAGGFVEGVGVRVVFNDNVFYAFSNDVSSENLIEMARSLCQSLSPSSMLKVKDFRKKEMRSSIGPGTLLPEDVEVAQKRDYFVRADKAARDFSNEVMQVTLSYMDEVQRVMIANSDLRCVYDERVRTRFTAQVVARRGNRLQSGYDPIAAARGLEVLSENDPADCALRAAKMAVNMLDAIPAPAGRMPVVIEAGAAGTMLHEACGHGLEGDSVVKNSSVYAGKLGEMVAGPNVTLVDDATLEGAWGSFGFDDEGYPARRNILVEGGVLVGYLFDSFWGGKAKRSSTGNGRRESYAHVPLPRMTNTFLLPGDLTKEDIIKQTTRGVYGKFLSGGQVDPATGDFVFSIQEGYLIENGELADPIRGATLIGNGPRVLFDIDLVGNDLKIEPGICGKEGQSIPNGAGCPTIRIAEITVGGTGESL